MACRYLLSQLSVSMQIVISAFCFIALGITPLLVSRGRYVTWRAIRLASITLPLHRVCLRYRSATTSHH